MYSTCVHCLAALGANESLGTLPVGRRLAFDSARGRLWVICPSCDRWNLTPLEERWEAAEECERAFSLARARYSTENIALARLSEGTELVRIGRPLRPEFAAWRYGRRFSTRAARLRRTRGFLFGSLAAVGAAAALGLPGGVAAAAAAVLGVMGLRGGPRVDISRLGALPSAVDGTTRIRRDEFYEAAHLRISQESELGWELVLVTEGLGDGGVGPFYRYRLVNQDAVMATMRILASVNYSGGTQRQIASAVRELERVERPGDYFALAASRLETLRPETPLTWETPQPPLHQTTLGELPVVLRLALEMALHEDTESRALLGELAALEAQWKEAEELASIADGLLVPSTVEQQLDRVTKRRR